MSKHRAQNFKKRYGITVEQYEKLLYKQAGVCAICFTHETTRSLHVDHSHSSGKIRGLLCSNCNTAIGLLKENVTNIKSAIKYLRKHSKGNK